MKYLDPKADLTFKRVFGKHPDLVISLLNALLPITEDEAVTDIEYLPADMVPDNPLRKYSIVDVRCRDKKGRQYLVEMQVLWLRYLTEIGEKTRKAPKELLENPEISKALTVLEESAFDDAELARYEGFWDMISVERTLYNSGWRKGVAEGKAEGIAEGEAKGKEVGLAEGKAEGLRMVALNMKKQGMDNATIAACTGLDIKIVDSL